MILGLFISACGMGPSPQAEGSNLIEVVYSCRISGRVVKVTDGDTVTVLDGNQVQHKIRLAGIDAPERGQAFGGVAKQFVSDWIDGKQVCVDFQKRDRWGRVVGAVVYDGNLINLEVLKAGLAWHYKAYEKDQRIEEQVAFARAEMIARKKRSGLWADNTAVSPRDYRKHLKKCALGAC